MLLSEVRIQECHTPLHTRHQYTASLERSYLSQLTQPLYIFRILPTGSDGITKECERVEQIF